MFKKSSELCRIQSLKGQDLGYIRVRNGVTTVVWLDKIKVVSMSFTGPASVVFGKLIVECDGRRVIAPKTIAQPVKSTKKELGTYIDTLFRIEQTFVDKSIDSNPNPYAGMLYTIGELTVGTDVPHQVKWQLEEGADKRLIVGRLRQDVVNQ